jgi:uncharacterized protein involved in outer membrane biogenesis
MKSRIRKLAVAAGITLGVLAVLGVGLKIFFPAEKIKEMAVARASAQLGRDVSVGEVAVSLRGGLGVKMQDCTVANPAGWTGPAFLEASSLDLKLKIRPLLRKEIRVSRLVLDEPRVNLVKRADGTDNFTFAAAAPSAAAPSTAEDAGAGAETGISFDRLEINRGQLTYGDAIAATGLRLAGLNLTASLNDPGPGQFQSLGYLTVDSLQVEGAAPVPVLAAALDYDLSVDTRASRVDFRKAEMEIDGLPLAFTGNLNYPDSTLTATGQLTAAAVALDDLLGYLTPEQMQKLEGLDLQGQLAVKADLDFDRDRPVPVAYTGQAVVTDFKAVKQGLDGDLSVPRAVADFEPDRLQLDIPAGQVSGQDVKAQLSVRDFADPRFEGTAEGRMDLSILQPYLPPERQGTLAGVCDFFVKFSGAAALPDQMEYSGTFRTANLSYREPELPDNLEQMTAAISFDPRTIVIESCDARFASGRFQLTGKMTDPFPYFLPPEMSGGRTMKTPRLTFDLKSPRLDVDRMFPAAAPAAEGAPGVTASKAATRSAVVDSSLPDIEIAGVFRADTLIYSQVPFTAVTGKVKMADRVLTCYDVTGEVYRGAVQGAVVVDLNNLNAPAFAGDYQASKIEVDNFVTRFAGMAGIVFGSCDMQGSFKAAGRDPADIRNSLTLDSSANITSGRVVTAGFVQSSLGSLASNLGQKLDKEQALKDLVTHIKVDAGRVGLDQLTTRLGTLGDFTLNGFYGFDGKLDYTGMLRLSEAQTAKLFSSSGALGGLASLLGDKKPARVDLPVFVNGTREKPNMGIDFVPLTNQLQASVADEAKDKLKEEGEGALKDLLKKFK